MTTPTADESPQVSCFARVVALLLVTGITAIVVLHRHQLEQFKTFGYIGAFLAMLLSNATVILPAPGLIVVFALGSSLNPVAVGIAGALGATLGEITGYLAGYSGVGVMEHSQIAQHINHWMRRNGMLTIFALSMVPNPFFDLAGVFAGAGRMPLVRFFSATFFGKSIQATAIAVAGLLSIDWIETWLH